MSRLIETVNNPEDLKKLPLEDLSRLASEIRRMIIETVSERGGHLASSLGAVELAIAAHYVFDGPQDDILWDVGHQAYAHKILTGRGKTFHTLRQLDGISGFPRPSESPYDAFGVGHSSTSISAALGLAVARDLNKRSNRVIAVIGDGSMTAGLAFEGLNQAGHLKRDMIVVLNDNEMSISKNVGALSSFLSRKITGRFATALKREIENFLNSIPLVGDRLINIARRAEDSLITLFTPGMLFEGLGFNYVGPIDGHNIRELVNVFNDVKGLKGPVLIHALTMKGKGYGFAEKEPSRFHGVGPFDIKTGKSKGIKKRTYTNVFSRTLLEIAHMNDKIIAITAAMPEGTGLDAFSMRFPERFFDVGIAEQHAMTFAAGLSIRGFIPVAAIYSTFLQRAYDEVLHDICLQNLHVIIALDRAGIVGRDGPTHHGLFDISYLRHIPNIVIAAPKDEDELRHLLFTAVNIKKPTVIRYPRGECLGVDISSRLKKLEIGEAQVLREGKELNILAVGTMVCPSVLAAERIEKDTGASVGVINCRFIKPIDDELIVTIARDSMLLTVEENALQGGFGSAVLELLADRGISCNIRRIGVPDKFVGHGSQGELRRLLGLDAWGIVKVAREMLKGCKQGRGSVSISSL